MMARTDLGLGRKAPPDRDGDPNYLMVRALASVTERLEDPPPMKRSWGLPARFLRHQGATGTCTEHGSYHLVVGSPIATRSQSKLWPQYSAYREYILDDEWPGNDAEATGPDSGLQFGSSVRAAMKWLQKKGYISGYAWAFQRSPASLWVRTKGIVVQGTNWYESMFNLTTEGIAKITKTTTLAGGHCYAWIGADEHRGLDLYANSWDNWGIDRRAFSSSKYTLGNTPKELRGFFMMAAEDTERLIHEDGECATATETKWKPQPLGKAAALHPDL